MNNQVVIQSPDEAQNAEKKKYEELVEEALRNANAIFAASMGLSENNHYLEFQRLVLLPAIETTERRMKSLVNNLVRDDGNSVREIIQAQGMLEAFKVFADLKSYAEKIKVEIKNLNEKLNG